MELLRTRDVLGCKFDEGSNGAGILRLIMLMHCKGGTWVVPAVTSIWGR